MAVTTDSVTQLHFVIKVKSADLIEKAVDVLVPHAKASLEEPGVRRFDMALLTETVPEPAIMIFESYTKYPDDYEAHTGTDRYKQTLMNLADFIPADAVTMKPFRSVYPPPENINLDPTALPALGGSPGAECMSDGMNGVVVDIQIGGDVDIDNFIQLTIANCSNSLKEEGIARFDLLQSLEDERNFALVEIYYSTDAPAAHKATDHYLTWRAAVENMMARPRSAVKVQSLFPRKEFWSS